jgi:hypothetical protein
MITLDPEFLGRFAPQSKLTKGIDAEAVPFARQPRLNRLRIQGKADETEDVSEDELVAERPVDTGNPRKRDYLGREKRKMRGKDKSLKRCVRCLSTIIHTHSDSGQILAETEKKRHRPQSCELTSSQYLFYASFEGQLRQVALREAIAAKQRTRVRFAADDNSKSDQPSALDRFHHR